MLSCALRAQTLWPYNTVPREGAGEKSVPTSAIKRLFLLAVSDHIANNAGSKQLRPIAAAISFDTTIPLGAISSTIPTFNTFDTPDAQRSEAAESLKRTTPSAPQQPRPKFRRRALSAVSMVVFIVVALVLLDALCPVAFTGILGGEVGTNPDPLALVRDLPLNARTWGCVV